jgi:hypothetical protein
MGSTIIRRLAPGNTGMRDARAEWLTVTMDGGEIASAS